MKTIVKSLIFTLMVVAATPAFGMFRGFARPLTRAFARPMVIGPAAPARSFFGDPCGRHCKFLVDDLRAGSPYTQTLNKLRFWRRASAGALAGIGVASYAAWNANREVNHLENIVTDLRSEHAEAKHRLDALRTQQKFPKV